MLIDKQLLSCLLVYTNLEYKKKVTPKSYQREFQAKKKEEVKQKYASKDTTTDTGVLYIMPNGRQKNNFK